VGNRRDGKRSVVNGWVGAGSMNYEVGKWGIGEVGKWGSGEVGKLN